MKKHKFIVIEGVDTAGKTSVEKVLLKKLKAITPKVKMKGTPDKSMIYDKEFYREYNKLLSDEIKKLIKLKNVLQVRYIYSNLVNEFLLEDKINKQTPGIIEPDYIIYLVADLDEIEKRFAKRKKRSKRESLENVKKQLEIYGKLFKGDKRVIKVDTTGKKVEETVEEIMRRLR